MQASYAVHSRHSCIPLLLLFCSDIAKVCRHCSSGVHAGLWRGHGPCVCSLDILGAQLTVELTMAVMLPARLGPFSLVVSVVAFPVLCRQV